MVVKAKNYRGQTLMEIAIACENIGVCTVCNKNMKKANLRARKIDGLWLCGHGCTDKFLQEKKKWPSKEWNKLCQMQALYVEQKQADISNDKSKYSKKQ